MIKNMLDKLVTGTGLSLEEARQVMNEIMKGNVNHSLLAGLLIALKVKGESAEEVAGFTIAMRERGIKLNYPDDNVIDVCGTGGDNSGTFNISTAAAFVAAGAGVKVAKHGNRSISSNCGSADVLSELGVNINLTAEKSIEALNKIGITFLFAPQYHPAMKYAAQVRKELGTKTIFNLLGPLTNPAGVKKQIIGTYNNNASELYSQAAQYLDFEKVCFLCAGNKYDEIILDQKTKMIEYNKDGLNELKQKFTQLSSDVNIIRYLEFEVIPGIKNLQSLLKLLTSKQLPKEFNEMTIGEFCKLLNETNLYLRKRSDVDIEYVDEQDWKDVGFIWDTELPLSTKLFIKDVPFFSYSNLLETAAYLNEYRLASRNGANENFFNNWTNNHVPNEYKDIISFFMALFKDPSKARAFLSTFFDTRIDITTGANSEERPVHLVEEEWPFLIIQMQHDLTGQLDKRRQNSIAGYKSIIKRGILFGDKSNWRNTEKDQLKSQMHFSKHLSRIESSFLTGIKRKLELKELELEGTLRTLFLNASLPTSVG